MRKVFIPFYEQDLKGALLAAEGDLLVCNTSPGNGGDGPFFLSASA